MAEQNDLLERMCTEAGAPGSAGRAAACEAVASRLAKAAPPARVWMLRQLERYGRAESVAAVAALLSDADEVVRAAMDGYRGLPEAPDPPRTADFESLRWFPLPGEILAELRGAMRLLD